MGNAFETHELEFIYAALLTSKSASLTTQHITIATPLQRYVITLEGLGVCNRKNIVTSIGKLWGSWAWSAKGRWGEVGD